MSWEGWPGRGSLSKAGLEYYQVEEKRHQKFALTVMLFVVVGFISCFWTGKVGFFATAFVGGGLWLFDWLRWLKVKETAESMTGSEAPGQASATNPPAKDGGWKSFRFGMGLKDVEAEALKAGFLDLSAPEPQRQHNYPSNAKCPSVVAVTARHPNGLGGVPIQVTFKFVRDVLYKIEICPEARDPEGATKLTRWPRDTMDGIVAGLTQKYGKCEHDLGDGFESWDWQTSAEYGEGIAVRLIRWADGEIVPSYTELRYTDEVLEQTAEELLKASKEQQAQATAATLEL